MEKRRLTESEEQTIQYAAERFAELMVMRIEENARKKSKRKKNGLTKNEPKSGRK